jgi:hypothetical protein
MFLTIQMLFIAASAERSEGRGDPELVLQFRIRLLLLIPQKAKTVTPCSSPLVSVAAYAQLLIPHFSICVILVEKAMT